MTKTVNSTPIVVPETVRRKAGLRRGEQVEFRVSGREITIVPKARSVEDYPREIVDGIIKETKRNPMNRRQQAALDRDLAAYGLKQAKKTGIKEHDIPRIIHESRTRRRAP